jgi:hypothetical protein
MFLRLVAVMIYFVVEWALCYMEPAVWATTTATWNEEMPQTTNSRTSMFGQQ